MSKPLLGLFTWYCRRYLRRHFHSIRLSQSVPVPRADGLPLVLFANHASWWDALVCLVLKDELYSGRRAFAPIDAAALEKYRFFRRLGFFGVEQGARRGAAQFLRMANGVLSQPNGLLVLTPQGRFADVRERPLRFAPGLGHLAARGGATVFAPLAIEYVYWEERLPEVLIRFGEPVTVRPGEGAGQSAASWTRRFEGALESAQDALGEEARARQPGAFVSLLRGGAGQGGVYDAWRRLRAAARGETFRPEHGVL
ncbi:MAG: lysophospholipid acyltransferase family protein [Verrucomicrobiota bacterium]